MLPRKTNDFCKENLYDYVKRPHPSHRQCAIIIIIFTAVCHLPPPGKVYACANYTSIEVGRGLAPAVIYKRFSANNISIGRGAPWCSREKHTILRKQKNVYKSFFHYFLAAKKVKQRRHKGRGISISLSP